ncbi:hypothetical protein amrb99_58960 [Actinomadura sp. RB99]|uniref:hypothetical protein n=1 Tax=Actinomadura sp. RB99 TaxID=2691577 RepID=UPI00168458E0|nr:hypothetical protein [Actinomadura sp. RB99]MBD2896944.1 hypothetical protein [Actinomadura sp. RB99]
MDAETDLLGELKALRKGFGLDDPNALSRIGPRLRLAAGVTDGDDDAATRAKVRIFLLDAAATLPAAEAKAIRAGFAVNGSRDVRLEARLRQLGEEIGCDLRTVKRRLDAALRKVAGETRASTAPEAVILTAAPWHLERLDADVRLDPASTEVQEVRNIISHRDGLRELAFSYSAAAPVGMSIDVLRGGIRTVSERCSTTRTRVRVELPRPLRRAETYGVTLKVVTSAAVPFYVCTPRSTCTRFNLAVGFRGKSAPGRVWLVQDELPLEAGDPVRARVPVPIDATGRATASFTRLISNRSYGLAWSST